MSLKLEMKRVNDEIKGKQQQIANLERQIKGNLDQLEHTLVYYLQSISFSYFVVLINTYWAVATILQSHTKLLEQLNEKVFELEVHKFPKNIHFHIYAYMY